MDRQGCCHMDKRVEVHMDKHVAEGPHTNYDGMRGKKGKKKKVGTWQVVSEIY